MAQILNVSIDLNKINKAKIKQHENGAKYYNLSVIVNDEKDKFGNDVTVTENQTKKERENKEKKVYLGNGKCVWSGESNKKTETPKQETHSSANDLYDLPF